MGIEIGDRCENEMLTLEIERRVWKRESGYGDCCRSFVIVLVGSEVGATFKLNFEGFQNVRLRAPSPCAYLIASCLVSYSCTFPLDSLQLRT
jgi:hypothetical protein